ncbi:hypothetical protein MJM95_29240, partial [Salmonella enterica subsp. enterica serovar Anatum]|nr:hypothetical protein [Salmonella enterica subsp. enterica serovar Anatum]
MFVKLLRSVAIGLIVGAILLAVSCFLPDRTNRLSALHQPQIRNAIWKLTRKKQNCLVKETFSSK